MGHLINSLINTIEKENILANWKVGETSQRRKSDIPQKKEEKIGTLGLDTETMMLGRNIENRESIMIARQLIAEQAILKFHWLNIIL